MKKIFVFLIAIPVLLALPVAVAFAQQPLPPAVIVPTTAASHLMLWLGVASLVLTLIGQALKTNTFDAVLAGFGIPALPKRAVPWITLIVGVLAGLVTALLAGRTLEEAAALAITGLLAGGVPVVGHELFARKYKPEDAKAATSVAAARAPTSSVFMLIAIFSLILAAGCGTLVAGCSAAEKKAVKTAVDITTATCVVLRGEVSNGIVDSICAAEEELAPIVKHLFAARKLKAAQATHVGASTAPIDACLVPLSVTP